MKTVDTELFGSVAAPESFNEIIGLLRPNSLTSERAVFFWRGQADIDWPIHSAAYRRLSASGLTRDFDLEYYEKDLLKRATHRGYRQFDGRRLSDFDLLARLQHHGAATRLVDATRNSLVGLYFAVCSEPTKMGALFGINCAQVGGYESEPQDDPYADVIDKLRDFDHPQTWEPPMVSPRIAAQHSQFLFSAVSAANKGSLSLAEEPNALLVIAISAALKQTLMTVLSETFDIRQPTLFPDIDGFGRANSFEVPRWSNYRW